MKIGPVQPQPKRRQFSQSTRSRGTVILVALLVLCGTTYAGAAALPKSSVGTKQLKKNAVTTKKLKKGAVTAAKVKKNSLTGAQINEATLATVPSAANADLLDGLQAGAFALAGSSAPPSGPAGGALTGNYPSPGLDVSGGPCPNGEALINVSSQGALTCAPGVFTDDSKNVVARRNAAAGLGTGEANTAFGSTALQSIESGESNSAFGQDALASDTTGSSNSAFGGGTLNFNTVGEGNVAVGSGAMNNNLIGNRNVAVGLGALQANLNGNGNVALGPEAMVNNQSGSGNTAVGRDALSGPSPNANFNSALGAGALTANTTGSNNLALGAGTMFENTTGSNNVAIAGGNNLTTGSNNIVIANNGVAGESNTTRIGQGQTRAFLAGVAGVTTGGPASPVLVDGAGQLGTTSSSRRVKRDIRPLGLISRRLMALRPVSFRYRRSYVNGTSSLQFGLIAEQVARVYPNLVVAGEEGRPSAVAYQQLPALLLAEVQRQERENDALRSQNRRQQAQIDWLIRQARRR